RLDAIVIGSSWKRLFASGLAPMLSPAITVTSRLRPYCACLALSSLARYGAPPAYFPYWAPPVSRFPWRSLNARMCTSVVPPVAASAYETATRSDSDFAPAMMTRSAPDVFDDASGAARTTPTAIKASESWVFQLRNHFPMDLSPSPFDGSAVKARLWCHGFPQNPSRVPNRASRTRHEPRGRARSSDSSQRHRNRCGPPDDRRCSGASAAASGLARPPRRRPLGNGLRLDRCAGDAVPR